jgi:invasion protein IalB
MLVTSIFKHFRLAALAAAIMISATMAATMALAQTGEQVGENGAWKTYRSSSGDDKTCFITSVPTKLEGEYNRNNRGETRVFVSHHGKDSDERGVVSVVAGYKYEEGREVVFAVDGKKYNLFSVDTRAWSTKPSMDKDLVNSMRRGSTLKVTGISSRGNTTVDTYSLKGFTAAMKQIDEIC